MKRTVHIQIEGHVQGVSFRAWTEARANELGLSGWVRNRRDGWVEALFSGPEQTVEEMLSLCDEGPSAARVERVKVLGEGGDSPTGFHIRPTI